MNVLIATDLSEAGLRSVEGVSGCEPTGFERITLLHVIDLDLYTAGGSVPGIQEWAQERLLAEAADLRERGFSVDVRVETGPVVETIHDVADAVGADLLVVTNLGKGAVVGRLLGSTAERLALATHRPVLLERVGHEGERWCRVGGGSPFARILLGVDLGDGTASLMQKAATMPGAELVRAVHVVSDRADAAEARENLEVARTAIPARNIIETAVVVGHPADALLAEARRWDATVIAVGSCRHGMLYRGVLGSVARTVATHSDRAVLMLPTA